MSDSVQVTVDKATFLEVGRVFKRVFRPAGAANVILTLRSGCLRIEFHGGGCELPCATPRPLLAELTAKSFAGIMSAHRSDKPAAGNITLTFRPDFGEFATPLAGAKTKFHQPPISSG
jgi:hypothetical protein